MNCIWFNWLSYDIQQGLYLWYVFIQKINDFKPIKSIWIKDVYLRYGISIQVDC